ncbi:MAG: hypothetical protein ACF788_02330, partial [Novipirellula sp. JB048]
MEKNSLELRIAGSERGHGWPSPSQCERNIGVSRQQVIPAVDPRLKLKLMPESKFRVVSESDNGVSKRRPTKRTLNAHHSEDRRQREFDRLTGVAAAKTVDVSLKQIVPLLIDAEKNNRTWLSDFAEDT